MFSTYLKIQIPRLICDNHEVDRHNEPSQYRRNYMIKDNYSLHGFCSVNIVPWVFYVDEKPQGLGEAM